MSAKTTNSERSWRNTSPPKAAVAIAAPIRPVSMTLTGCQVRQQQATVQESNNDAALYEPKHKPISSAVRPRLAASEGKNGAMDEYASFSTNTDPTIDANAQSSSRRRDSAIILAQ
jgi:hypothetical protein